MEEPTSRAGSHAGRGFRYQDAAGVLLAVRCWTGDLPYGAVVPEGLDDYELRIAAAGGALVQAKSRREHLGPFSVGEAADFVLKLWSRAEAAAFGAGDLILLLERPISGGPETDHQLVEHSELAMLLQSDPRSDSLAPRTKVWLAPAPLESAVATISQAMSCQPLPAQVYFGELLQIVGALANQNGLVKDRRFEQLTVSDVEATLRRLEPLLSPTEMESALRNGYCEAIDFLTPVHDPSFYQGVNARPGHLAAGLVAERPEACRPVLEALERRGSALIVGPSGIGKSALMWDVARTARHTVRWFEVRRGAATDAHSLIQLARLLRASPASPVGFVVDDVGRGFADLWDVLAGDAVGGSGLVILGSIREEDVFLPPSRSRSPEIRPVAEEAVAERIWLRLREQGETASPGWREAWGQCEGLLLEYTHILTRGDRLEVILREQLDRRLREHRDAELAALGVVSLAGAAGALVDVVRLASAVNVSQPDLARALQRLVDEHLVAAPDAGVLSGLHQLRSETLLKLLHQVSQPLAQTIPKTVHATTSASLEAFVAYVGSRHRDVAGVLVKALVERLDKDRDPVGMAGALSGLGQTHVETTLERWLPQALSLGLEPTQITSAVMLAVADTDLGSLPFPDRIRDAVNALNTRSDTDPRLQLLSAMPKQTLQDVLREDIPRLRAILGVLVGVNVPEIVRSALADARPDLESADLSAAADLLGAMRLISRDAAIAWTEGGVRERLLARVSAETPWATAIESETAPEGRLLRSAIYHVAPSAQEDVHGEVVQLCELMFGLDPTADVAAVDALSADGSLSGLAGFPVASKRIQRKDAPPSALPQWNRRWTETAARLISAESHTGYLQRAYALLEELLPALERSIDAMVRGKTPPAASLDRLGNVHEASRRLTPPRAARPGGDPLMYVTKLQNLLFCCSADLLRHFHELPEGSARTVYWINDLLKQLPEARNEPWVFVESAPNDLFDRLEALLASLRLLAAEAGTRDPQTTTPWKGATKDATRGNALRRAKIIAEGRSNMQSHEYLKRLRADLTAAGVSIDLHIRPCWDEPIPWPPIQLLGIVDLIAPAEWQTWVAEHAPTVRAAAGEGRQIFLAPRIKGLAASRLTVSGISTMLPSPYAVDEWLDALHQPRLDDPLSRAAQAALDHLVELDGMRCFGLGASGRPPLEQAVRARHESMLADALSAYEALADGKQARLLLREFAESVTTCNIGLAEAIAGLSHGQVTPALVALADLSTTVLSEDLQSGSGVSTGD